MRAARAAALLAASLACASCNGCGEQRIAELVATLGTVQRDFSGREQHWQAAATGEGFQVGDALRTGSSSRAELRLLPQGKLRVEADTVVRFSRTPPERAQGRVELEAGAIELESAGGEFEIGSASGTARLGRGGRVRVRSRPAGLQFQVDVGRVLVERGGKTRELHAGESFALEVGAASVERAPRAAPVDAGAAAVPPSATAAADPSELRFDPAPARADIQLPAGESATVHDPGPPTRIRVYGGCAQQALALEVARADGSHFARVRGQGGAIVALPRGQFHYRVRCLSPAGAPAPRSAAEGRLLIVRDAGTRKLPSSAPAVTVAADGRRYTVRYQNLPPKLSLRWPAAPQAAAYTLELRAGSRTAVREQASAPNVTLPSGRLEEGVYGFWFEAAGKRSPESTLSIVFDNAARIAYLSEPHERGFEPGARVRLLGAALRGARIEVDGKPLQTKAQGRFDSEVAAPSEREALSVRVQHPATGIHYYLRRAAKAVD